MNNQKQSYYEQFKNLSKERLNANFINACVNGYLGKIIYLLNSTELKEHADIHIENDRGFRSACANWNLEVVKYFIFDMNIEKTQTIKAYLSSNKDYPNEKVEGWFKMRELNQSLEEGLSSNKVSQKKIKL